jgi:putative transposase
VYEKINQLEKYKNKYRIPSARLPGFDYGSNGAYFITICTQNRTHFFGQIVETRFIASRFIASESGGSESGESRSTASEFIEPKFIASELGELAEKYWLEIPTQFPFIELGEFIIMPNHIHGILIIDKTPTVETRLIASLPGAHKIPGGITRNNNPMFHENISRIIRWYKGRCTFEMRKIHADFAWQSRFHDHIIRDAQSFETIENYIANNVLNWEKDKFYG